MYDFSKQRICSGFTLSDPNFPDEPKKVAPPSISLQIAAFITTKTKKTMHPIPCLTHGKYLAAGIVFFNSHRHTLRNTNRTVKWNTTAPGVTKALNIIQTYPAKLTTAYLSTSPFIRPQEYSFLERGVATAINLDTFQSFFLVGLESNKSERKKGVRKLYIRNLILPNKSTLIIPALPTGQGNTGGNWFVAIGDALLGSGIKKIIFKGGGNVVIPDWFRKLCQQLGIDIVILEPNEFDRQFPEEFTV